MYQDNLFAIDLSKKSIQGALFDKSHRVRFNREFSPKQLVDWLSRQKSLTVAMEACSTAHHWVRVVERLGHRALLVPTRTSNKYREGHKTMQPMRWPWALPPASRQPNLLLPRPLSSRRCNR